MLLTWGWPNEAREQLEISKDLAPSKVTIYCFLGHTYRLQRDPTNAIAWYLKTLDFERQHAFAYGGLKETYQAIGDYAKAIENAEKEAILHGGDKSDTEQIYADLRRAYQEGGKRGYWQQRWQFAEKDPNEDFYGKACIQIRLGNTDPALDWLNKAFQARRRDGTSSGNLQYLLVHECWDGVRDHPRFKELLEEDDFFESYAPTKIKGGCVDLWTPKRLLPWTTKAGRLAKSLPRLYHIQSLPGSRARWGFFLMIGVKSHC